MLTAKQVANRLQVSPSWVYAHKRALGAFQLSSGGAVRFNEQYIEEIANAVPNEQRAMESDQNDKRSPQAKSVPDQGRSKKMGITANGGIVATADPYGLSD